MKLAQVFLHAGGFKLEGADGTSLLIEFVGLGVVDGNCIEVNLMARSEFHVLHGFFQDGERLQPEEVHLDQTCGFNDVAVVLRAM